MEKDTKLDYLSARYWCFQNLRPEGTMIQEASRFFIYALMANNAYDHDEENPKFRFPGWTFLERQESPSGLALDVYESDPVQVPRRLVIAYEGTNGFTVKGVKDWKANLSPPWPEPAQFREAAEHLRRIRQRDPDSRITVTGHSLGGGIAFNMSLRFPNVTAVGFNASPRAFFKADFDTLVFENERTHFGETGEVLQLFNRPYLWARFRLRGANYSANYNNFLDYRWYTFSPVPEHSIYAMSRALLLMAISAGNETARVIFRDNIPLPLADAPDCPCAGLKRFDNVTLREKPDR